MRLEKAAICNAKTKTTIVVQHLGVRITMVVSDESNSLSLCALRKMSISLAQYLTGSDMEAQPQDGTWLTGRNTCKESDVLERNKVQRTK